LTINPTAISQAITYYVTVTRTLVYDARVIRSTAGNRVETTPFEIVVSTDCSTLSVSALTQTCGYYYIEAEGTTCNSEHLITD
jgi:hypothetical protein